MQVRTRSDLKKQGVLKTRGRALFTEKRDSVCKASRFPAWRRDRALCKPTINGAYTARRFVPLLQNAAKSCSKKMRNRRHFVILSIFENLKMHVFAADRLCVGLTHNGEESLWDFLKNYLVVKGK